MRTLSRHCSSQSLQRSPAPSVSAMVSLPFLAGFDVAQRTARGQCRHGARFIPGQRQQAPREIQFGRFGAAMTVGSAVKKRARVCAGIVAWTAQLDSVAVCVNRSRYSRRLRPKAACRHGTPISPEPDNRPHSTVARHRPKPPIGVRDRNAMFCRGRDVRSDFGGCLRVSAALVVPVKDRARFSVLSQTLMPCWERVS